MKRHILTLLVLLLWPQPNAAPVAAAEVPVMAHVEMQWTAARTLAREFRPLLKADSARLSDSLAFTIVRMADRHGIDRHVAFGLVYTESRFSVRARGRVGEIGLTQVLPSTARRLSPTLQLHRLYDPAVNLDLGFRYLSELMGRYHNRWFALVAYNRGPANADRIKRLGLGYPERVLQ